MSELVDALLGPQPANEALRTIRERRVQEIARVLAGELGIVLGPYIERYNQGLVEPVAGHVGYQELLKPPSPSPGQSFRLPVTGEAVVTPLSIMARLTTSATVAQRSLTVEYRDDADVRYLVAGAPVTLPASQAQSFCWHPLAGDVAWPVDDAAIAPLPQQFVYPGFAIVLKLGNAQAGDQLDQVRIMVEKFQTG